MELQLLLYVFYSELHLSSHVLSWGFHELKPNNSHVYILDPCGKKYTSEALADDVYRWLEQGGSRLVFVIGGGKMRLVEVLFLL